MPTIKYYDGRKIIEVETSEEVAKTYQEIKRKQWSGHKRQMRNEVPFFDADEIADKMHDLEREEELKTLRKMVETLTADQQRIIEMVYAENLSLSEIGDAFGISKQSAHERLQTILKKLKKKFEKTP